jgi:hypothetical protein
MSEGVQNSYRIPLTKNQNQPIVQVSIQVLAVLFIKKIILKSIALGMTVHVVKKLEISVMKMVL